MSNGIIPEDFPDNKQVFGFDSNSFATSPSALEKPIFKILLNIQEYERNIQRSYPDFVDIFIKIYAFFKLIKNLCKYLCLLYNEELYLIKILKYS